jgi:hypothetical protein
MKVKTFWDNPVNLFLALDPDDDDTFDPHDALDSFVTELEQAQCEESSPCEVAMQQQHLAEEQREKLGQVLVKCAKLFGNQLKMCPHHKIHLDLPPGAVPVHSKPCSVPRVNECVFKEELEHLCNIGVLACAGVSEWAAPSVDIAEKDEHICVVNNFGELNTCIERKVVLCPTSMTCFEDALATSFFLS